MPPTPFKNSPLDDDNRHLHQLDGALAVLQGLRQVQHLAAHHRHLVLEQLLVETLIRLPGRAEGYEKSQRR